METQYIDLIIGKGFLVLIGLLLIFLRVISLIALDKDILRYKKRLKPGKDRT